jgi:PA domain
LRKNDGYDHRDALFGIPPYGGSIQQQLYYADNSFCDDDHVDTFGGYPQRDDHTAFAPPFILMIDRGDCTFVKKVRNAQRAGAAGVLIADNMCICSMSSTCIPNTGDVCETQEPIMADDGSGTDISIPSFLLFKQDADPIRQVLMQNQHVRVEMAFSVPAPDARVEYALWTTPADTVSRPFESSFKEAAIALDKDAFFSPHMYIYDGIRAGCMGLDGENQCYNLCTNNGRYCATDPDDDLDSGISGVDVVTESLRRICIWNNYGQDGIGIPWWDYIQEFMFRCDSPTKPGFFNSPECITDAMVHASVDKSIIDKCMSDTGGLVGNTTNTALENELKARDQAGVVLIPSFFVNQAPIRGSLSFSTVFKAVCSGFAGGSEPTVCKSCATCHDEQTCVTQGHCPGGEPGVGGVPIQVFAGALAGMTFLFLCVGYIQYQRQQRYMRDQVRGIMAEYMPLDGQNKNADTSAAIEDTDNEFTIS